jgi:hypothetical protein
MSWLLYYYDYDMIMGKELLATTEKKAAWAPQPVWRIWTTEIYLAPATI